MLLFVFVLITIPGNSGMLLIYSRLSQFVFLLHRIGALCESRAISIKIMFEFTSFNILHIFSAIEMFWARVDFSILSQNFCVAIPVHLRPYRGMLKSNK